MPKIVNYHDYCRSIRSLKETNGINKSLKFLLLDFADRHGKNGMICPSNATLAESNCISEKSIEGLLSRARKNNLIKTSPARKNKPRLITLLCPIDGSEIFLQIRKKDSDNFAYIQKKSDPTLYKNDKVKNNGFSPSDKQHIPTLWVGFLYEAQNKDPTNFDLYLSTPEDRYLELPQFKKYISRRQFQ